MLEPVCPNDRPDIVELKDIVDALEPLRVICVSVDSCVDAFRAGSAGDACASFRLGKGGGPLLAGNGGVLTVLEG
jgi:hypothetical protein